MNYLLLTFNYSKPIKLLYKSLSMNLNHHTSMLVSNETETVSHLEQWFFPKQITVVRKSITSIQDVYNYALKAFPDFIFIDLDYDTTTVFSLLKKLKLHCPETLFIAMASDDRFALQAIKGGTFDYLLKPVKSEDLDALFFRIQENLRKRDMHHRINVLEELIMPQRKLSFNTRGGTIIIKPDDIFYIEADCNYSEIYFTKTKSEIVSMNIGSLISMLPGQFIRISRSIIINTDFLTRISSGLRTCYLSKNNETVEFSIPEKQTASLKRTLSHHGVKNHQQTPESLK